LTSRVLAVLIFKSSGGSFMHCRNSVFYFSAVSWLVLELVNIGRQMCYQPFRSTSDLLRGRVERVVTSGLATFGAPRSLRNIKYTRMRYFEKRNSRNFSLEGPCKNVFLGPAVVVDVSGQLSLAIPL